MYFDFFAAATSEQDSDRVLSSESATSDEVSEHVSPVVYVSTNIKVNCMKFCVY